MTLVMVKTFLGQPIIRLCDGEELGKARIKREGGVTVWLANKEDVYILDTTLFEAMQVYDEELDKEPEGLVELWRGAIPYFARG